MSAPTRIPLKRKYRVRKPVKNVPYRSRTGPRCCNDGCPARKGDKRGGGFVR